MTPFKRGQKEKWPSRNILCNNNKSNNRNSRNTGPPTLHADRGSNRNNSANSNNNLNHLRSVHGSINSISGMTSMNSNSNINSSGSSQRGIQPGQSRASLTGSGLHFSWFDLILIGFDRIFVVLIWF